MKINRKLSSRSQIFYTHNPEEAMPKPIKHPYQSNLVNKGVFHSRATQSANTVAHHYWCEASCYLLLRSQQITSWKRIRWCDSMYVRWISEILFTHGVNTLNQTSFCSYSIFEINLIWHLGHTIAYKYAHLKVVNQLTVWISYCPCPLELYSVSTYSFNICNCLWQISHSECVCLQKNKHSLVFLCYLKSQKFLFSVHIHSHRERNEYVCFFVCSPKLLTRVYYSSKNDTGWDQGCKKIMI